MDKLIIITVLLCLINPVFGQSKEELENRKQQAIEDIQQARNLLERTARTRENNLRRINILNSGIRSRQSLIELYETQIENLSRDIEGIEEQISVLDEEIAEGKKEYEKIILATYKNHTNEDKIMYLLASEDLNQFYQRIKYLRYLADYRERKVAEIEELIDRMNTEAEQLKKAREEKLLVIEQNEEERRLLSRERSSKREMIDKLAKDERRLREELREKERIKNQLEEEIRRIIEAEASKTSENSIYSTLTPEQRLIGSNFSENKGRLPWPVEKGIVTAKFGIIPHPVLSGVKLNNNGIDISSVSGSKARAVFDGEVSNIVAILGANYTVIVMHGEFISVYQNLVDLKVKVGEKVSAKQEIGTIFSDENDEIGVLHFQIWKERDIMDPEMWISK